MIKSEEVVAVAVAALVGALVEFYILKKTGIR